MATLASTLSLEDKLNAANGAERLAAARNLSKNYVLASAGIGLVPVPLADLGALLALEVKLVHGLAGHYGVPFKENIGKALLAALFSGASGTLGVLSLASLAKAVPGLGSLVGGGGVALNAASVTYAVGEVFIRHFESGGTLLDFKPEKMQALFRRALRRGKPGGDAAAATAAA